MSATNRGAKRRENDAYYTPAWCVEAIMPHLPDVGYVLDPFCGDGSILLPYIEAKRSDFSMSPKLVANGWDIVAPHNEGPGGFSVLLRDSFAPMPGRDGTHPLIVTNPPYSRALDAVKLCLHLTRAGGTAALLLRLNFLEGVSRKQFWLENPCDVYVLSKRPSFTGDGKTDATAYAWFVWGPGRDGKWWVI